MLVFAASDKGGTGRSVTSCNIAYRRTLSGEDACYLDFDFGSPTAGSIFQVVRAARGVEGGGLHSYFGAGQVVVDQPQYIDVWTSSARASLRTRPPGSGRLTLVPGDQDGAEFQPDDQALPRCVDLLLRLEEEYGFCLVDLSAGRSYATQLVLQATAMPPLRNVVSRWLVFHRWTRQHIPAAAGLAFGRDGILEVGVRAGHDAQRLRSSIRFVRTAVVDPASAELAGLRAAQISWLLDCHQDLLELAAQHQIGQATLFGEVPLDPVLQWREQLLSDNDAFAREIANRQTIGAFADLARKLADPMAWEPP